MTIAKDDYYLNMYTPNGIIPIKGKIIKLCSNKMWLFRAVDGKEYLRCVDYDGRDYLIVQTGICKCEGMSPTAYETYYEERN